MDRFNDGAAVVPGLAWDISFTDALNEVSHLLRKPIVPDLLVDRKRPTGGGAGLLDGIAVAAPGECLQRVAIQHVGVDLSLAAESFGTVVHAPRLCPAFLGEADGTPSKVSKRIASSSPSVRSP